jgi:hypothetical protein
VSAGGSSSVTERWEVTALGHRRFRCRDCGRQFNQRSGGVLNRTCLPSDIISFVIFFRLRYWLSLRDLSEILLLRGFMVSHGRRSCCRLWEMLSASGGTAPGGDQATAGTSTRRISRFRANGAICIRGTVGFSVYGPVH